MGRTTYILTHLLGDRVESSQCTIDVHVRPFWERRWFLLVLVASGMIAFAAALKSLL